MPSVRTPSHSKKWFDDAADEEIVQFQEPSLSGMATSVSVSEPAVGVGLQERPWLRQVPGPITAQVQPGTHQTKKKLSSASQKRVD